MPTYEYQCDECAVLIEYTCNVEDYEPTLGEHGVFAEHDYEKQGYCSGELKRKFNFALGAVPNAGGSPTRGFVP